MDEVDFHVRELAFDRVLGGVVEFNIDEVVADSAGDDRAA